MNIVDSKTFGQQIKTRRNHFHFTQKDISDFSGLSTSFISDVEQGKSTCEIGKCIQLANILGLDIKLIER